MFNFRNKERKEEKKYRGTKIYLSKIDENIEVERLLAILFSMFEGYIRQENKMPEKIVLSAKNYERIMNYNNKLIIEVNDKKYILCVELEVERNSKRK